ncbi:UNVERIFIED_CONTAM: hypothetical protein PYX00_003183 [Menopon gallinae]|uniref:Protein sleepless n=1 Tax=Menopon gallinae TaxID=328185 RepID=A0AAW2HZ93_9NEOP
MVSSVHCLALIAVIFGLAGSGDGLRCWVCKSDKDYNCGDPFNYTHFPLVDCERRTSHSTYSQSFPVCSKIVSRVNGQLIVERDCAWEQSYDNNNRPCSSARNSPYAVIEHCSTCVGDACNGAHSMIPSTGLSLALSAASYIAVKYM